jgi:phosphatidate cytidylyltransferase
MLSTRILVAAILLPVGLVLIYLGGPLFTALVALVLGLAAWEFGRLFRAAGYRPSLWLGAVGAAALAAGRGWDGFASAPWLLALFLLVAMTFHLVAYERGRDQAGTDFALTLAAGVYLGWLGSYLVSLRGLPGGFWWLLLVLPSVWLADSAAYFIGRSLGQRRLSPRLSPKKTWEGYLGGVVVGSLGAVGLAALWQVWAGPEFAISYWQAGLLGLLLSTLTTLGDLGESMIKRQAGLKDSGSLLPGHGGVFDRIDSWLWAAPIGYYFILWVVGV